MPKLFAQDLTFNPNIYRRLKIILCEKSFADFGDGKKEKIYSFDRTISSFLLPSLRQDEDFSNYFINIRDRTNAYFEKFFGENLSCDEAEFYFGVWSDIILRTTEKPAELMTLYEEKFDTLEERFDNSTRATTVQKFLDKVSDAELSGPLPHAYFQNRLGRIRRSRYRIKDLPLSKSERLFKLYIMSGYANVLEELKRYTDEIKLCEEIVDECERYLPDDIDLIIEAN